MDPVPAQSLRQFNRSFTRRIGVLDESFLETGLPLAAARLLFEIGLDDPTGGVTVRELRDRLGLDSGYVSRLLRQLEGRALVIVVDDELDARRRHVRLSRDGRRAWQTLDRRSDELAEALLRPLPEAQRTQLAEALQVAERLLCRAGASFRSIDATGAPARHAMQAYFAELERRFDNGFDATDAFDDDVGVFDPPSGSFLGVFDGDRIVGCGGVRRLDDQTSEVKRMWLHPAVRGAGLGLDLLTRLEREAAMLGSAVVVLDTNEVLASAIALYQRAGYVAIDRYNDNPYAHHWFRKELA